MGGLAPGDPAALNVYASRAYCLVADGKNDEARDAFESAAMAMKMFTPEARRAFADDASWAASQPATVLRWLNAHDDA